jgi:hypothetical protein
LQMAARFPLLDSLAIAVDEEAEEEEEEDDGLDLSADGVRFPALKSLDLQGVGLQSLILTEANTPALEVLALSRIPGLICPFQLSLPRLRSFSAEFSMLGERHNDAGQFGLSLSRCPSLTQVQTFKFRGLGRDNYLVLPSATSVSIKRSEGTTHLDILYAPKLRHLSVKSCYNLQTLRLRNVPGATAATAAAMSAAILAAQEAARTELQAEDAKWRDQGAAKRAALTQEAHRLGWLQPGTKWCVAAEAPPDDDEDDPYTGGRRPGWNYCEEILQEHIDNLFRKKVKAATAEAETRLLAVSVEDRSHPRCLINTTGSVEFRIKSLEPQVQWRYQTKRTTEAGKVVFFDADNEPPPDRRRWLWGDDGDGDDGGGSGGGGGGGDGGAGRGDDGGGVADGAVVGSDEASPLKRAR